MNKERTTKMLGNYVPNVDTLSNNELEEISIFTESLLLLRRKEKVVQVAN